MLNGCGAVVRSAAIERLAGRLKVGRAGEEMAAIGVCAFDAEVLIDHAIDLCPLVPGETPPEPDGGVRTREVVGFPHEVFPSRAERDGIKAAVPAGQRVALEEQSLVEKVGMMRGKPEQFPDLRRRAEDADLIGTNSAPSTSVMIETQSSRVQPRS